MPLILDHNIRNTRQIATAFQPLVDHPMRYLGGDGPDVTFVPCAREDAMDAGDDQIDRLLDDGWRPEDVALLTTGSRHPEQIARQAEGTSLPGQSIGVFRHRCVDGVADDGRNGGMPPPGLASKAVPLRLGQRYLGSYHG